jgi:hypothetical protein
MANPTVEKLKEAGLRYGDKVAVALTSLLFLVCFALALNKKSIEITPEEVKKAAETADANINRRQDPEAIIKILEDNSIKLTRFAKDVEDSAKSQLVADNYRPDRQWITPEPGAGLLRDKPVLIAPADLYAYPSRGGALVYALDEQGNKIVDDKKDAAPKEERRGRRRRRGGMGGMMGGMMGGNAGMMGRRGSRKSQAEIEREQKEEVEQKKREIAAKLAGRDQAPDEKDEAAKKDALAAQPPQEQYKEVTKALHWVAITGVLDHAKLVANYREALKSPGASPHYARLDLERQTRQKDGSWSPWEKVDAEENLKVLDNLPEEDEELTPDTVRPDNLNDPLPFLKSGLWEKVHIASLVPKEKKEVAPPPTMAGGMGNEGGGYSAMMSRMGGMMGGSGPGGGYGSMMQRMGAGGMGGNSGGYGSMMQRMGSGGMMGDNEGMGGMMRGMGGMGGMGGGAAEVTNFWKSEEKRVMIRALDFTPDADASYRYRVRIVVFNPNHNREDVNYGVDTKVTELIGPWSEPTDEVTMPADVAAYAMGVMPRDPKSDLKVNFQVVRFDLNNGVTVPRKFAAGPGEVIGEVSTADIPTAEGTGKTSKPVDFNTRQIVLDTAGGMQPLPAGFAGGAVERPALALLLRPDGSVQVRNQPDDVHDEVRKDIERNYVREVKDSNKKRENSMGSGYGGMMEMMMGGGMRGMGGMGGMGGRGRN